MSIVNKIKNSIRAALGEDYPVYYHDEVQINLDTSRMEFPCAVVHLITQGTAVIEAGQAKEVVSAAVFFVALSEFDFDADDNEEIIAQRKTDAMCWLLSLGGSHELQLDRLTRTSRVYEEYDDIVTGFGVLADIRETSGFCTMPEPPTPPTPPEPEQPTDPEPEAPQNDNDF